MSEEKEFQIKGSITRQDIPKVHSKRISKYEGIYCSLNTLEVDEGIEVGVKGYHVGETIKQGVERRFPRRCYSIDGRAVRGGYSLFIMREK
jgi:hypothetical protein